MILSYMNLTIDSTVAHQSVAAVRALSLLNSSSCIASFIADQRRVLTDSVSEVIGNEVQVYPEQHLPCIFLYGSQN